MTQDALIEHTIRRACANDVVAILTLVNGGSVDGQVDPENFRDPVYLDAFRKVQQDDNQVILVMEVADEIVATIQISVLPGLPNRGQPRAILEYLHVRQDQRGRGLGSFMMEHAIAECRKLGCWVVILTTNKARSKAPKFYEDLGFTNTHLGFKLIL